MDELFKKLNIIPKDMRLYEIAFSHSSYANEHRAKKDYERLEFLGDAVVDLVMADYLYRNHDENEGTMTKVRASYVCENALYEYSLGLGLNNYIKVGHGEELNGGKHKKAIVADIFEVCLIFSKFSLDIPKTMNIIIISTRYLNKVRLRIT